ncbi:MAG: N-methyl-D-aspartate receptor NMDAR2C subunit [Acidobacteria bacterium]|nr:N-methyl-D-aspartate receptor NMDAR2C subunit [Acidobacteriota bacterium]
MMEHRAALRDDWLALWRSLDASGDPEEVFRDLESRYSEPGRAYHGLVHIAHCLGELRGYPAGSEDTTAVEFALWFHDAVYDSRAGDNEERSAALARQAALEAGLPAGFANQVTALILATKHSAEPDSPEARLLTDIDLSILGQPDAVFDNYARGIRQEYAWVPFQDFAQGRRRVLEAFAARNTIFSTPFFRAKYEQIARANLARSISLFDTHIRLV